MNSGIDFLRELTAHVKYARYLDENLRKENFRQIQERTWNFLLQRLIDGVSTTPKNVFLDFYARTTSKGNGFSFVSRLLRRAEQDFYNLRVLPAMRVMQFAGEPILKQNQRVFNCSYTEVSSIFRIADIFYMLLCGVGVGYSVRKEHIQNMPEIVYTKHKKRERYAILDSIEGWREAVLVLLKAYTDYYAILPKFDYSLIRPKGSLLRTTGGLAPGHEPLKEALEKVEAILSSKNPGERLSSLELSDIICILADCVVSGGSRRSALIALFSPDDPLMANCKTGNWFETHVYRSRANFSGVIYKGDLSKEKLWDLLEQGIISGYGEPGVVITNCEEGGYGVNPCAEIGLRDCGVCNLTEINMSACNTPDEFYSACISAALLGTIQATFYNFSAVELKWSYVCYDEALLGVGITGICSSKLFNDLYFHNKQKLAAMLRKGVELIKTTNKVVSKWLGFHRTAKRLTCIKPAGSTSCILGTSSGVHACYAPYFIRRMRVVKDTNVAKLFFDHCPELIEIDITNSNNAVISIPIKMDSSFYTKDMDYNKQLELAEFFQKNWVEPGWVEGKDPHNVSVTVTYPMEDYKEFFNAMYNTLKNTSLRCISFFPASNHKYPQAPFEEVSESEYNRLNALLQKIPSGWSNYMSFTSKYEPMDYGSACEGAKCDLNL